MKTDRIANDELVIDERKSTILKTVVDSYIDQPSPVASKTVGERSALDVSPATIRNEMKTLENAGYLTHPHTSSGRIPTDRGYRFFVDHFVSPNSKNSRIFEFDQNLSNQNPMFGELTSDVDRLLEQTVVLLASLTQHTALIVKDSTRQAKICDLHISRLEDGRCVVALFFDDSSVERVVVEPEHFDLDFDYEKLVSEDHFISLCVDELRGKLAGISLRDLKPTDSSQISPDFSVNTFVAHVMNALSSDSFLAPQDASVHVAGVANIAKIELQDENSQREISAQLLSLIEQHMRLVELVRSSVDENIGARIGSENKYDELSRHSIVLAPFTSKDGESGAVGIIGPTRMDYSKIFTYLNSASGTVEKYLDQ